MEPLSPTEPLQSTAINAASLLPETEQSSVQTEDLRYAERGCGESLLNTSCAGGELPPASPDVPSPSTSRAATSSLFPNSISTDTATAIDAHTTSHSSEHIRDDTSPRDQSASQPREQPLDQQGSAEGLNSGNDAQNAKMSEIKEGDQGECDFWLRAVFVFTLRLRPLLLPSRVLRATGCLRLAIRA